jgi:hypothetical protein
MSHARSQLPFLAVLLALSAACAGRTPYDPFLVPKESIFSRTRTIALAPSVAHFELEDPAPVYARFDSLIAAELKVAGFTVVPAQESFSIWKRLSDSLGGLFDPRSGERDTVRLNTARRLTMIELRGRFGADAWLHPSFHLVRADFRNGTAKWDGAKESYQSTGGKILNALAGVSTYGTSGAISLSVVIENMQGVDLYSNRGGVQLYMRPKGRDFVQVDRRDLFVDPLRNHAAVRTALGPFVRRGATEP